MKPFKDNLILFILMLLLAIPLNVAGAQELTPGGDLVSQTYASDGNIITQNPCVINSGINVVFATDMKVFLRNGFIVKRGGTFMITRPDDDGLPNAWEKEYFGNYDQGAHDDPDGDGLTNIEEYTHGISPISPDSDGDGINDFIEVTLKTSPSDPESIPNPGMNYQYDALGRIKNIIRVN